MREADKAGVGPKSRTRRCTTQPARRAMPRLSGEAARPVTCSAPNDARSRQSECRPEGPYGALNKNDSPAESSRGAARSCFESIEIRCRRPGWPRRILVGSAGRKLQRSAARSARIGATLPHARGESPRSAEALTVVVDRLSASPLESGVPRGPACENQRTPRLASTAAETRRHTHGHTGAARRRQHQAMRVIRRRP